MYALHDSPNEGISTDPITPKSKTYTNNPAITKTHFSTRLKQVIETSPLLPIKSTTDTKRQVTFEPGGNRGTRISSLAPLTSGANREPSWASTN